MAAMVVVVVDVVATVATGAKGATVPADGRGCDVTGGVVRTGVVTLGVVWGAGCVVAGGAVDRGGDVVGGAVVALAAIVEVQCRHAAAAVGPGPPARRASDVTKAKAAPAAARSCTQLPMARRSPDR